MAEQALLAPEQLRTLLQNGAQKSTIRLIDCSWYLPNDTTGDPRGDFESDRFPGAVRMDIDECSDQNTELPHMMPTAEHFENYMTKLGIGVDDYVVVYDFRKGIFASPRAYFMFRAFGHKRVSVLNGGRALYKALFSSDIEVEKQQRPPLPYKVDPAQDKSRQLTVDYEWIKQNLSTHEALVLDARSRDRFDGSAPEPRAGIRSGHIPFSICVPFTSLLTKLHEVPVLKEKEQLKQTLQELGVPLNNDNNAHFITSCGSGMSASIVGLTLQLLGYPYRLYDGSWTDYASRPDATIESVNDK